MSTEETRAETDAMARRRFETLKDTLRRINEGVTLPPAPAKQRPKLRLVRPLAPPDDPPPEAA